jgi:glyoxylase-like metal-dependent hydrolase (beta-lactamase superfamily II)
MSLSLAGTTQLNDGIVAIDTEYARPMQDASHLIIQDGKAAFVDTGANSSVPFLLNALQNEGLAVADVDYVFLTHIHLDHAGGAGLLMQKLPNARCVVHPRGAPHMIDPSKLIAGTEAVYGKARTQEIYGDILPIDEHRMDVADDGEWFELNGRKLQALFTEGHARHHYVLNDPASKGVFTGDSFGVSYRETDTSNGAIIFPTATPIDFDPDEAHKSVDRIMACKPEHVYLTHFSRVGDLGRLAADMHQGIDDYVAIALANEHAPDRQRAMEESMFEYMSEKLGRHGFTGDSDAMMAIMQIDVGLNAQGLGVWLDRRKKRKG